MEKYVADVEALEELRHVYIDLGKEGGRDKLKNQTEMVQSSPFFLLFANSTEATALDDVISRNTYWVEGENDTHITALGPTKKRH